MLNPSSVLAGNSQEILHHKPEFPSLQEFSINLDSQLKIEEKYKRFDKIVSIIESQLNIPQNQYKCIGFCNSALQAYHKAAFFEKKVEHGVALYLLKARFCHSLNKIDDAVKEIESGRTEASKEDSYISQHQLCTIAEWFFKTYKATESGYDFALEFTSKASLFSFVAGSRFIQLLNEKSKTKRITKEEVKEAINVGCKTHYLSSILLDYASSLQGNEAIKAFDLLEDCASNSFKNISAASKLALDEKYDEDCCLSILSLLSFSNDRFQQHDMDYSVLWQSVFILSKLFAYDSLTLPLSPEVLFLVARRMFTTVAVLVRNTNPKFHFGNLQIENGVINIRYFVMSFDILSDFYFNKDKLMMLHLLLEFTIILTRIEEMYGTNITLGDTLRTAYCKLHTLFPNHYLKEEWQTKEREFCDKYSDEANYYFDLVNTDDEN